jgi:hypothetical protein
LLSELRPSVAKLTPGDVERASQRLLDDGLAPSSVAKVVQALRMMLDHAVREGGSWPTR